MSITTPEPAAPISDGPPASTASSIRKGRGSQVFTQEMACALVEMYYARKKDFPGSGYSLPPEGFEAIVIELRNKFNVNSNEIDQQTLKKKLSNIRTRVRNRCRDMRPDADINGLNLTPSEKIYFRYFGPPGSGSGASTPLPNGINDTNNSPHQQGANAIGIEQNGHSPAVENNLAKDLPLSELVSATIMRIYAENLHLFTAQNASTIKNIDQQRFGVFDAICKHLLDAYHLNMDITQVRARIDEVVRSLAQKMDDFRRLSGVNNENIVLRPINLTSAEAELFDAQFTESPPDPRKAFAATSSANSIILPSSSTVEAQKLQQVPVSGPSVDGQQPLVQINDGFYSVILPSSSNGMPALPEPTNAPSSMLISPPSGDLQLPTSVSISAATVSGNLLPPPNVPLSTVIAPGLNSHQPIPLAALQAGPSSLLPGETSGLPSTSSTGAPPSTSAAPRRPAQRKNNKRKSSPAPAISDAEMERRFQETIEAVLSPANKKTKVSTDEKRDALMAVEKQRTLKIQRSLAEEQLVLVRKQQKLADDQINFYKIWTEIGNRIRGFLRP